MPPPPVPIQSSRALRADTSTESACVVATAEPCKPTLFRSGGSDDAETGLEPAWPHFPQGLSSVLDAGRPTAALALALRRWGGGFGLTPHFQRLR